MLRPLRRAFCYPRPVPASPAGNGLFVGFAGPAFGLLTAPRHLVQDPPDGGLLVLHAEAMANYLGDSGQGPQLGVEARGSGAFQEYLQQLLTLPGGQLGRRSRVAFGQDGLAPSCLVSHLPLRHRPPGHAYHPADLGWSVAGLQKLHGPQTATLQFLWRSRGSHA